MSKHQGLGGQVAKSPSSIFSTVLLVFTYETQTQTQNYEEVQDDIKPQAWVPFLSIRIQGLTLRNTDLKSGSSRRRK